jgi:hypothetical protein
VRLVHDSALQQFDPARASRRLRCPRVGGCGYCAVTSP